MEQGKISTTILKRSVMSYIHGSDPAGVDCAALKLGGATPSDTEGTECTAGTVYAATAVAVDESLLSVRCAVIKACNNILASGGRVLGIEAACLIPASAREIRLKEVTKELARACAQCHTKLVGGHTEVTGAVSRIVVTITALGEPLPGVAEPLNAHRIRPGLDIIVTKWLGLEAVALLNEKEEHRRKWEERFTSQYLEEIGEYADWLSIESEAAVAVQHGAQAMHDVSDGGIFAALWEIAEGSHCGFVVELEKLPFRQPAIEVMELEKENLYRGKSSGSLLIFTESGSAMCEALEAAGIPAGIVGQTTEGHDKILRIADEVRYLDKA